MLSAVIDLLQMVVHPGDTLVEAGLVVTVQVGQMDLQPAQSTLAQRLSLGKLQQPSTQIIANMVQIGRDGVSTSTEIDVVREIQGITNELRYLISD